MDDLRTTLLDPYLSGLQERGGSDLLLIAGAPPMLRVNGELEPLGNQVISPAQATAIARELLPAAELERLLGGADVDVSFGWGEQARVRAHVFHQRGSITLSLRLIPRSVPSLASLGLPAAVERLGSMHQGLILVTGPTGSGKSTTLAALVRHASEQRRCHVVTIEDPIEYFHAHGTSVVSQREVGIDVPSFAAALRAVVREDPDIVLVGEMRDLPSIEATLTIAETGHLVLATLHSNDAAQAVDRVIDVFPSDRQSQVRVQLAATLVGVVAQRLVPTTAGGRVAATEVLVATPAVRNLIRDGRTEQLRNVMSTGQRDGMHTIEQTLADLAGRGIIPAPDPT